MITNERIFDLANSLWSLETNNVEGTIRDCKFDYSILIEDVGVLSISDSEGNRLVASVNHVDIDIIDPNGSKLDTRVTLGVRNYTDESPSLQAGPWDEEPQPWDADGDFTF